MYSKNQDFFLCSYIFNTKYTVKKLTIIAGNFDYQL